MLTALALVAAAVVAAPATSSAEVPADGGYVADAWGGLHPFGNAPAVIGTGYWPGRDLTRGVAVRPEGGGWTLDAWGGLHPFGGAPAVIGTGYWPGRDLARGVVLRDDGPGGWTLDAWGGLHAFGGAPAVSGTGWFPSFNMMRGLVLNDGGPGGWTLDAWGGLHPFGGAPAVSGTGWFPGRDMMRGVVLNNGGPGGWTLDAWGGLHPFGGAPAVIGTGYFPTFDMMRGIVARPGHSGGWTLDAWGGLHRFGDAPGTFGTGWFPGRDMARGASGPGGGSGGYAPPPPRRRTLPVLRRITYSFATRGAIGSNFDEFTNAVKDTLDDERGWARAGIEFVPVPAGGELVIWLSEASRMSSFDPICSSMWSCATGRNAIINDDRFRSGSPYWPGPLVDYRRMVINHEVGHTLGFGHYSCGGAGQLAPVMQQQSKGMQGCVINPWPLQFEIDIQLRRIRGFALPGVAYEE